MPWLRPAQSYENLFLWLAISLPEQIKFLLSDTSIGAGQGSSGSLPGVAGYAVTVLSKISLCLSISMLRIIMAEDRKVSNELIYATLQDIQTRVGRLEDGINILSGNVSALDTHMAGFYRTATTQNDQINEHRGRIEVLERDAKKDDPKP